MYLNNLDVSKVGTGLGRTGTKGKQLLMSRNKLNSKNRHKRKCSLDRLNQLNDFSSICETLNVSSSGVINHYLVKLGRMEVFQDEKYK